MHPALNTCSIIPASMGPDLSELAVARMTGLLHALANGRLVSIRILRVGPAAWQALCGPT